MTKGNALKQKIMHMYNSGYIYLKFAHLDNNKQSLVLMERDRILTKTLEKTHRIRVIN